LCSQAFDRFFSLDELKDLSKCHILVGLAKQMKHYILISKITSEKFMDDCRSGIYVVLAARAFNLKFAHVCFDTKARIKEANRLIAILLHIV